MNLLFATQANSLRLFAPLAEEIAHQAPVERVGFTLADSQYYGQWLARNPGFERRGYRLLKEWEITAKRGLPYDLSLLAEYEEKLGLPGLFGAVVADRRLLMGPDCTYTQDYRRRFSDDQLYSILQQAVLEVERLFDEVKPDMVVTFICVTILDYLVHFFARGRGIPAFNLRPAKIGNQVLIASTLRDPAPELCRAYRRIRDGASSDRLAEAKAFLESFRAKSERYEGAVPPSSKPAQSVRIRNPAGAPMRFLRSWYGYRRSEAAQDNHVPGIVRPAVFRAVISPWRARRINRSLADRYLRPDALDGMKFAFYPMHTEPEVSLMVYNRPILNQIEVVRWLALSLPADMVLVIKEHPWMVGKRSADSYRKLLQIPRVRLAAPGIEARTLIEKAALVAVLSSSVGQEAAFLGRPVLTLGPCAFNLLPASMVGQADRLYDLDASIRAILKDYAEDDDALAAYVAALLECSVPVDLYGGLLKRGNLPSSSSENEHADIERLARSLLDRRKQGCAAADRVGSEAEADFAEVW